MLFSLFYPLKLNAPACLGHFLGPLIGITFNKIRDSLNGQSLAIQIKRIKPSPGGKRYICFVCFARSNNDFCRSELFQFFLYFVREARVICDPDIAMFKVVNNILIGNCFIAKSRSGGLAVVRSRGWRV